MSLFSINQKINSIITNIERMIVTMKQTTPQPNIQALISSSSLIINMSNIPYKSFSLTMTNNITSINFQNCIVNGNYMIFLSGSNFIINKSLGSNIKTNLSGNIMVIGSFVVNIYYDGIIYYLTFNSCS